MSDEAKAVVCDDCGTELKVGAWPFCKGDKDAHKPTERFGLESLDYYDVQLLDNKDPRKNCVDPVTGMRAIHITSRGERQKLMKEKGVQFGTQKFDRQVGKLWFT
jgi:hypothetical protein